MDTTIGQNPAKNANSTTLTWGQRLPWLWVTIVAAAILMAGFGLWLLLGSDTPGDSSAEAGFARDMSVHHAQAVEMALIAQERTDDPEIRFLATDIILTQQGQIGQMRGWLDAWDVPPNSSELPMTWMDHPTEGRMPGMASPEEIEQLRALPVPEMERLFLELMIVHHQSGVEMAEAVLERSDNSTVGFLAQAMAASQQKEIDLMQDLLERKGFDRVPDEPATPGMEDHSHH